MHHMTSLLPPNEVKPTREGYISPVSGIMLSAALSVAALVFGVEPKVDIRNLSADFTDRCAASAEYPVVAATLLESGAYRLECYDGGERIDLLDIPAHKLPIPPSGLASE